MQQGSVCRFCLTLLFNYTYKHVCQTHGLHFIPFCNCINNEAIYNQLPRYVILTSRRLYPFVDKLDISVKCPVLFNILSGDSCGATSSMSMSTKQSPDTDKITQFLWKTTNQWNSLMTRHQIDPEAQLKIGGNESVPEGRWRISET